MTRRTRTNRNPSQVVLYLRVSTDEQATRGLSLDAQRRELDAYAASYGLSIDETFVDAGCSGTTDARPEFRRMMAKVLSSSSTTGQILIIHGTRFMRDAHLAAVYRAKLKKAGVALVATQQPEGDGPLGELMAHLMDGIAQFESQTIGIRARAGMEESARMGWYPHSTPPFGFGIEKVEFRGRQRNRLKPCPEEAETVRTMFSLYQNGLGGQAIAARLNTAGATRRGARWNRDNVLKTLGDTAVTGVVTWGRTEARTGRIRPENEWVRIEVEGIIDQGTFERVQVLRAQRDPVKNPGRASSSPLLLGGGIAKCGHCGASLQLQSSGKRRPDGSAYQFYCCSKARREGRQACPDSKPIVVQDLDDEVMTQVASRAFSEARARRILERLCDGPLRDRRERDIAKVKRVLDGLKTKKDRLIDALASGHVSASEVGDKLDALGIEIATREGDLATLRAALPPKLVPRKLVRRFQRRARTALGEGRDLRASYKQRAVQRVSMRSASRLLHPRSD